MADAASILPAEIWEIILVIAQEDEKDAFSCSQTCTLWHSTLQTTRTSWLFPFIYPHLHTQLKNNLKDVMSCRLVCKLWTKGIDTFMESHHFMPLGLATTKSYWLATQDLWSYLPYYEDQSIQERYQNHIAPNHRCETFMENFKESKRNPFISRTLQFTTRFEHGPQTLEFLNCFGHHIWTLKLRCFTQLPKPTLTEILEYLWDILECVPYLKYLVLSFYGDGLTDQSDQELQTFLDTHNTPKLPHLLFVDMNGLFTICSYLREEKFSRKLEKVLIQQFQSPSKRVTFLYKYDYVSSPVDESWLVYSFNLNIFYLVWDTGAPFFPAYLEALSHIHRPLEGLDIRVPCVPNVDQMFQPILQFKDTLRMLTFYFEKYRSSERIELPSASHHSNKQGSIYAKYFAYISHFPKLKRLQFSFPWQTSSPSKEQLFALAHTVLMEHWPDYRLAHHKDRQIEVTKRVYRVPEIEITVSLLKKERNRRLDDGYYPLSRCDRFRT